MLRENNYYSLCRIKIIHYFSLKTIRRGNAREEKRWDLRFWYDFRRNGSLLFIQSLPPSLRRRNSILLLQLCFSTPTNFSLQIIALLSAAGKFLLPHLWLICAALFDYWWVPPNTANFFSRLLTISFKGFLSLPLQYIFPPKYFQNRWQSYEQKTN